MLPRSGYNKAVDVSAQPVVDSQFLAELEGLRMLSRKIFRGQMRGERRSRNKGQSVEFVDYRPYLKGDDLRRIDWNLYGRLERYYIKLFEEEEDLRLYILLDCSASMDYGNPNKFRHALRLTAALSYIVLANMETVAVSVFAGDYNIISSPARGKGKIHVILHQLSGLNARGHSLLGAAAARFAAHTRKSGIVCVVSDFLMPEGISAIAPLAGCGHQIELIQVLGPEEANPQLTGDLELVDSESGEAVEVSMGVAVMRRYHQRLAALQSELESFARRGGGSLHSCNSSTPLKDFIFGSLRSSRLLR
jgi:uncharacterized protein (DUF58 family)